MPLVGCFATVKASLSGIAGKTVTQLFEHDFEYDLLVIGAGPGGLAASERAASYGARVAIVEQDQVGGTCVIHGCIPEKLMTYAASFSNFFKNADEYGWGKISRTFDWCQFMAARDQDIQHLCQVHTEKLHQTGVKLLRGHARLVDAHTVAISNHHITADKILIAVGAKANKPTIPGIEHAITTRELLSLEQQPNHLAIVGSNYIAVKQAGILNGLICKVSLIVPDDRILPDCDDEIRTRIQDDLKQLGVHFYCNGTVEKIERVQQCLKLTLAQHRNPVTVETVVFIQDRIADVNELGLENAGVELKDGFIAVDEYSCTTQANIFAVGDCTARPPWTPVAIATGRAFADTEFGDSPHTIDLMRVPYVISTIPEAATVGLTEAQARQRLGEAVHCYAKQFQPLFNLRGESDQQTLLKLVVDESSDRVLGAHMVGEHASEIIQMIGLAMQVGVTKAAFDRTIGIHPSVGEEFFTLK